MTLKSALFKEALLDHFKQPRNHRDIPFDDHYIVARGTNPRCGDDVEIGIRLTENRVELAEFRGRGCSVCIASTSMLTESISGNTWQEVETLISSVDAWFEKGGELPATLEPLEAVKSVPGRKKCAVLSWNALKEIAEKV